MIEFIYVLAGILAVIFGFYLGRGTYNQSVEEVEARMGKGKPRRAKRHFHVVELYEARRQSFQKASSGIVASSKG